MTHFDNNTSGLEYELVSFKLCPYVQRSVITLREKGVAFKRTDIELSNKPEWFLRRSPTGKVPMLLVNGNTVLFESAVICEFIDETTPGSMLPENPLERAYHRAWIEFGSTILNQIARYYSAESEVDFNLAAQNLRASFARVEAELVLPFFSGESFQIVDAVYAPIFRYFDVFEQHLPAAVVAEQGIFADYDKIAQWRRHLQARPSVIHAVAPDYPEGLIAFVKNKTSCLANILNQSDS